MVAASQQYLRGELGGSGIAFNAVALPDVGELFEALLEGYADLRLEPAGPTISARLDPYWVGVCVRNLVENARAHGRPPCVVSWRARDKDLICVVEDAGSAALSLREMMTPLLRGPDSHGLGLGLAVVARLTEAMGAELSYQPAPTRFTLTFRSVLVL